tara:strand:- start:130 stop:1656 length:1527 start_codon:yes stop_codon:yes gene_type:complete
MIGRWFDIIRSRRQGRHQFSLRARIVSRQNANEDNSGFEILTSSRNTDLTSIASGSAPNLNQLSSYTGRLFEYNSSSYEPIQGVVIQGDVRGFQLHLRGIDSQATTISLAEFGVEISYFPNRAVSDNIRNQANRLLGIVVTDDESEIEVRARYSYRIPGQDLARLSRLNRLMEISEAAAGRLDEAIRSSQQASNRIESIRNSIQRSRGATTAAYQRARADIIRLQGRIRNNSALIKRMTARIQRAGTAMNRVAGRIRGPIARSIAKRAVADWVTRLVRRGLTRFIPLLNVHLFISDAIELAKGLYHIATGQASVGFETGADEAQENPATDIENAVIGAPDVPSSGMPGTNRSNGINERGVEEDTAIDDRGIENSGSRVINNNERLGNNLEEEIGDPSDTLENTPLSNEAFALVWRDILIQYRFRPMPFFKFNNEINRPLEVNETIGGFLITNLPSLSRRVIGPVQVRVVRIGEPSSRTTVIEHPSFRAVDAAGRVTTVPENNFLQLFY